MVGMRAGDGLVVGGLRRFEGGRMVDDDDDANGEDDGNVGIVFDVDVDADAFDRLDLSAEVYGIVAN